MGDEDLANRARIAVQKALARPLPHIPRGGQLEGNWRNSRTVTSVAQPLLMSLAGVAAGSSTMITSSRGWLLSQHLTASHQTSSSSLSSDGIIFIEPSGRQQASPYDQMATSSEPSACFAAASRSRTVSPISHQTAAAAAAAAAAATTADYDNDDGTPPHCCCCVCLERPREVLLAPCGHAPLCARCYDRVRNIGGNKVRVYCYFPQPYRHPILYPY